MSRLCTVCGRLTSGSDSRCGAHPRTSGIGANHAVHSDPRWTALSRRVIAKHVGQFGWVCPGDGAEHPSHPSHDLTADHVVAIEDGGSPFPLDDGLRVLCRSWNSTLGARLVNARRAGRVMRRSPLVLDVRAQIRARFLG